MIGQFQRRPKEAEKALSLAMGEDEAGTNLPSGMTALKIATVTVKIPATGGTPMYIYVLYKRNI
jgi:hypothetical protein